MASSRLISALALGLAIAGCGTPPQVAKPSAPVPATAHAGTIPVVGLLPAPGTAAPAAPSMSAPIAEAPVNLEPVNDEMPTGAPEEQADFATHKSGFVPNQIVIGLKAGATLRKVQALGVRTVSSVDVGITYKTIELPAGMSVEEGLALYASDPAVESTAKNRIYGTADAALPNDPLANDQWGMKEVKAPDAWTRYVDARHITVAVLDTGIDYSHPDLAGRVMIGWNFAENSKDVMDRFGHGTHVAGIIGAASNNGQGVAGVCGSCNLMAIKVLGDNGEGSTSTVLQGIKYAADYGAKVINMSLGSADTTVDPALSQAIEYARARGVVVVAAAGNNRGNVGSPANDPGAIAVSSTSKFLWWEYLSWYSNRGPKVEVAAPGGGIWSTVPLGPNRTGKTGYAKLSGTSMAAPLVAGEAALIMATHPGWGPDSVRARIGQAVDDKGGAGRDPNYGYGRVRLDLAIQ